MSKDEYHAAVYEFIRRHYRHDRFEGSPHRPVFTDYPNTVVASTIEQIEQCGYGCISQFESASGQSIFFDANLDIIPIDVWLAMAKAPQHDCRRASDAPSASGG